MSGVRLRLDDYMILAIYPASTRAGAAEKIREVKPYLADDPDMAALLDGVLKKLSQMTDGEYRELDLRPFWQEPLNEYEEEGETDEQSLLCGG